MRIDFYKKQIPEHIEYRFYLDTKVVLIFHFLQFGFTSRLFRGSPAPNVRIRVGVISPNHPVGQCKEIRTKAHYNEFFAESMRAARQMMDQDAWQKPLENEPPF